MSTAVPFSEKVRELNIKLRLRLRTRILFQLLPTSMAITHYTIPELALPILPDALLPS